MEVEFDVKDDYTARDAAKFVESAIEDMIEDDGEATLLGMNVMQDDGGDGEE